MEMRQFLLTCCGAFIIGMLAGAIIILGVRLKNLSRKKKHEFHEPAFLKQSDILLSDEAMELPAQDTVDGYNALKNWRHDSTKVPD